MIEYVFLDVAGTLLHKPAIPRAIRDVLASRGIRIGTREIRTARALLSEATDFPTATTREFYTRFNARLLSCLGVLPDAGIIREINFRARDIVWEKYPDTGALDSIPVPTGIISNWDATLPEVLAKHFPEKFFRVVYSHKESVSKPDVEIFRRAARDLNAPAANMLYVGDSVRLDVLPARQAGFQALLLNRDEIPWDYGGPSIRSLADILNCTFRKP